MATKKAIIISIVCVFGLILNFGIGCTSFKRYAYEGFGSRDATQFPDKVIAMLNIPPGAQVVDLGAGGGYFTFRLAKKVGPQGRVYAVDIDHGLIGYLDQQIEKNNYLNVTTILAETDDPYLPSTKIDLIFSCNTYHHLSDRIEYFKRIKTHLSDNGRVAIIDAHGKSGFSKWFNHSTPEEVIRKEMTAAGYKFQTAYRFLPAQNFLIFSIN